MGRYWRIRHPIASRCDRPVRRVSRIPAERLKRKFSLCAVSVSVTTGTTRIPSGIHKTKCFGTLDAGQLILKWNRNPQEATSPLRNNCEPRFICVFERRRLARFALILQGPEDQIAAQRPAEYFLDENKSITHPCLCIAEGRNASAAIILLISPARQLTFLAREPGRAKLCRTPPSVEPAARRGQTLLLIKQPRPPPPPG